MNQSQKVLAALVAVPASVIVSDVTFAAENAVSFEINNDFVKPSNTTIQTSTVTKTTTSKEDLVPVVYGEMNKLTKGFTVNYSGKDVANYQSDIQTIFTDLKNSINSNVSVGINQIDATLLYGLFNNVYVKATETEVDGEITSVKLEFSFNYFGDANTKKYIDEIKKEVKTAVGTKTGLLAVKEIHDYLTEHSFVASGGNSMSGLKSNGSSAHAYALWSYILLKDNGIADVNYVSGRLNGQLHSWNHVKIGNDWYNLDIASDDNQTKGSNYVQYRHFLTNVGVREILTGGTTPTSAYKYFENMVTPVQVGNILYYADAMQYGKLYQLDLAKTGATPIQIATNATSGYGKIVHYKNNNKEYLYFINDAESEYVYAYELNSTEAPQLIVKKSAKSISITNNLLTYVTQENVTKTLDLTKIAEMNETEVNNVKTLIDKLTASSTKEQVLAARQAYNHLTPLQQDKITSAVRNKLEQVENTLIQTIASGQTNKLVLMAIMKDINQLDRFDSNYKKAVDAIKKEIAKVTTTEKNLIYNLEIYTSELEIVEKVEVIVQDIEELASVQKPFTTNPEFITKIEELYKQYNQLPGSLKNAYNNSVVRYMDDAGVIQSETIASFQTVIQSKRSEAVAAVDALLYLNVDSEDYLVSVQANETKYSNLSTSQKALLTSVQQTEIEKILTKAKTMQAQVDQITANLKAIGDDDIKTLTGEKLIKAKEITTLYQTMKPSQMAALASQKKEIENIISALKVRELNELIANLNENSSLEIIQEVKTRYEALTEDEKKEIVGYDKLAGLDGLAKVQDVIEKIKNLEEESLPTEIQEARKAYDELTTEQKSQIPQSVYAHLLFYEQKQEEQMALAKSQAQVVIDRINRITSSYTDAQIKSIETAYGALSQLAKSFISEEVYQKLLAAREALDHQNTVVKEAKKEANAFDVYMNDINRTSTKAEVAKARAYYNSLSYEAKLYVTTYDKLVRFETMWTDSKYLDLVYTYYPDYINAVKPGGIILDKPTYDSLYIPDDSDSGSSSSSSNWATYETMQYQSGRYTATITTTQAQNIKDRSKILKADQIEIVIPTADLKAATATVGVTVNIANNQLNIQFTEGARPKTFSDYVEVHVPFSALKGSASKMIERVSSLGVSPASFKFNGSSYIIRIKSSGTFKATTAPTYRDLTTGIQNNTAIRQLAKHGIQFNTLSNLAQSSLKLTRYDVALMISTALDISSTTRSSYYDIANAADVRRAQGLLEAGIMSGITSYSFNGNANVTKQEAAIIIANMYRYLDQDVSKVYSGFKSGYNDLSTLSLEARQSIAILELFGIVKGTRSFEPTKQLTRGEFAELLYKALTVIDFL